MLPGTLLMSGAPIALSITSPGQGARLTFAGTMGQRVNLGVSEVSFGETGGAFVDIVILSPDGTTLASDVVGGSGGNIDMGPLPDTGEYTVVVAPSQTATGRLTLTLSEPAVGLLTTDGQLATSLRSTGPGRMRA